MRGCGGWSVLLLFAYGIRHVFVIIWLSNIGISIWAATWQNQENDCAPSEDSDQPGRPPSLIRVLAVRMKKVWVLSYPLSAERRLWSDWTDGWSEAWLGAQSLCWFCHVAVHLRKIDNCVFSLIYATESINAFPVLSLEPLCLCI